MEMKYLTLMQRRVILRPVSCNKVLEKIAREVHRHPPHSPHLVPNGFHLFGTLKQLMRDQKFEHSEQIQHYVCYFLQRLQKTSVHLE